MLERGPHRVGVGVVRVVDDEAATGERQLFSTPRRKLDAGDALRGTVERKAERVVGVQRGERIGGEVPLRERELELDALAADGEARDRTARLDLVVIEAPDVDVAAPEIRLELSAERRHHRGAPCRKRRDRFCVRLSDALDRAEELEMLGTDVRNDDDVRARDLAERGDLAETAHPHLRHEHPGLRLEPADGERQADLVVEAALGEDRRNMRRTERSQDVLRRRLPRRADNGDDIRVALRAHERCERGERRLLIVGYERRRPLRPRLLDVAHAGVERDEEVSRSGIS